ncbi:aspartic proteinase II-1 [Microthyrium microscopicum]|uniref:Aspartic proteinase II-1 n=1 Tax=Microthyrium microscopicum TaxID=703497 RepID=A0A6A6UM53_9PEZI|nr:aspartic proteinase II-1 [Microthyrium microscopicum]
MISQIAGLGVCFCFFLVLPSSTGTSLNAKGKTFTLHQTAVPRARPWFAAKSVKDTHLKYQLRVPIEIENALSQEIPPNQTSVSARPGTRTDQMYVVNVQVGGQNMTLDLDTGSSDLWVVSSLLPSTQKATRPASRLYDPNGKTARRLDGHSFMISYGDQSYAKGQVYLDRVAVGDLVVPNQAVEVATSMATKFVVETGHDGLFGFAASAKNSVSPKSQLTWFDNIRPTLAQPVFTCSLKRHAVGSFDFGYIDKAKYRGDIVWSNVRGHRGYWDFNPTGFAIGDGEVHQATFEAIADTGSSLWYLPRTIADAYWKQVPGSSYSTAQGAFVFPCQSKLPEMTVIVSGQPVRVPGINMNYQTVSAGTCMGGINRDFGMPFSIFGDAFLKGLFVVHEVPLKGQSRIGFAAQARSD